MKAKVGTAGAADRIDHPALVAGDGAEVGEARCTDRVKLGVVLQGAGLLSLCDAAGWTLDGGWNGARVDPAGRLTGVVARPGRDRGAVQPRLSELLLQLFRAGSRVAGRGEARRAARELTEAWGSSLVPMSSDDAIGLLFETAPFLWEADLSAARAALLGSIERAGRPVRWIAGPPVVRERLGDPRARASISATELAAGGRWSDAVRIWRERPPAAANEVLAFADALHAVGRFEAALLLIAERDDSAALALRASCRLLLGELAAARELVERMRVRDLSIAELLDYGDLALRALALGGERDAALEWTARALAAAGRPEEVGRAQLLAATAALDAGDLDGADRHLQRGAAASGGRLDWRGHEVSAWLAQERSDGIALVEHASALLASRRRRMRRFEAGRAWNNLGIGHLLSGDFERAERAFEQSVRLLRRCDGPLAITLPQSNLAEARLRAGKLLDVEPNLRASSGINRRSGNARGLAADETLWVRMDLVKGNLDAALGRASRAFEECARRGADGHRPALAALAARAAGWLDKTEEAARWLKAAGAEGLLELEPEERPAVHALAGDTEAAKRATVGELAPFWNAVLRGEAPGHAALARLDGLDPFRRARLLLDGELLLPGALPPGLLAEASARFRRIGASRYAALLERADNGGWSALRRYLESGAERSGDPKAIEELFRAVGHAEADLVLRRPDGSELRRATGGGGDEELSAEVAGGTLLLRASRIDDSLRAIFALLRHEVESSPRATGSGIPGESSTLLGSSPRLLAALERLRQFAASEMPVLLLGESGTGKELAAKEVRRGSTRAGGPWVTVNCAALSETLLLSDLFGHARGAFTGAERAHAGVFETAHGGTVFLDEIGDLPPVAQGNLLRVLQEGEVRRLGESLPRKVDVRLIAATHRDLAALVREGKFRQDLYYRLKVCTVSLPPLRERGDDLGLLAESFLEEERRRLGRPLLRLAPESRRRLLTHSWPGNVRELQHAIRAAAALAGDGPIGPEALDLDASDRELPASDYHREVYEFRRALVARALGESKGNRAAAARQLGLSRQALSYLARELALTDEGAD